MSARTVILSMDDFEHLQAQFEMNYSIIAHCEPDGAYKLVYEGILHYSAYIGGHTSLEEITDWLFDKFEYDTRQFVSRTRSFEIETALINQLWSPEFATFLYQGLDLLYQTLSSKRVPATQIVENSVKHMSFDSYNQVAYNVQF